MEKIEVEFDATLRVGLDEITGLYGLIVESRGGKKGSSNYRNPDYSKLLKYLLEEISKAELSSIEFYLASEKGSYTAVQRKLTIDDVFRFKLIEWDISKFQTKLQTAISKFGQSPGSKSGNRTRRLLIHAPDQYQMLLGLFVAPKSKLNLDIPDKEIEYAYTVIKRRLRDTKFRKKLMAAYEGRCAVSGTNVAAVLEASHITPYAISPSNKTTNGILLRADLHTLFDAALLKISKDYKIQVDPSLRDSEYWQFHQKTISLPRLDNDKPDFK